jgi:hypothetical protein
MDKDQLIEKMNEFVLTQDVDRNEWFVSDAVAAVAIFRDFLEFLELGDADQVRHHPNAR